MTRRRTVSAAMAGLCLLAPAGCTGGSDAAPGDAGPVGVDATVPVRADYQWVIPKGTAAKVALIDHDQIFPPVMYAKVGQSIRIINEDTIGYTVGPFYIGPKQTLEQILRRPGVFEGACTTHRGGRLVLIVE